MAMPTLTTSPAPLTRAAIMTRNEAAHALDLSLTAIDKLIHTGVLGTPISATLVEKLARRPLLSAISGELTVLRTDARQPTPPDDDRTATGFHTTMSTHELIETSLRWWRCDPDRVVDNELFAVTVATIPIAVFLITRHLNQRTSGVRTVRHHFDGDLLARRTPDGDTTAPAALHERVTTIMSSRIYTTSGGPIGYLTPNQKGNGA